MSARWLAFVIWAAVAASAVFWALRLFVQAPGAPAHAITVSTTAAVRGDLTRVFGGDTKPVVASSAAVPAAESRFQLVGVVAPRGQRAGGEGLALIAVDGKPAKAFRVGTSVEGETVLQSVSMRGVALGVKGEPASVALEIPALPPAATGTMPSAQAGAPATVRPTGGAVGRPAVAASAPPPATPEPMAQPETPTPGGPATLRQ